jgi:hypothetical protein
MMGRMSSLPFAGKVAFDLKAYVTAKALDGMFLMIGREEVKIRKNPGARTTDLLKRVFGGSGESRKKKTPWWKKAVSGGSNEVSGSSSRLTRFEQELPGAREDRRFRFFD